MTPRFPSELYEAFLEGLCLLIVMLLLARSERRRAHPGLLTGYFLIGYGIARSTGECFREPDAFLGFLWSGLTMGQLLCVPMILAGIGLVVFARTRQPLSVQAA